MREDSASSHYVDLGTDCCALLSPEPYLSSRVMSEESAGANKIDLHNSALLPITGD